MSSVKKNKSKNAYAGLAVKLAAGAQQYLSGVNQILVNGGTYTSAQVVAQMNALIALRSAVTAAQAIVKGKLAEESSKGPVLTAFLDGFVSYVETAFSGQPDVLAAFGLAPKKARTPLTGAQQALATAKRNATRKARGIGKKKDRMAIKGDVTGLIMTPVTASSTPSPAPGPTGTPTK
jgi:hypothetical protein